MTPEKTISPKEIKELQKKAKRNDAIAQNTLGWCYEHGKGVEQDFKKAVEWYRKSAEQDNAEAQTNLGDCYHDGKGIDPDYETAVKWFKKAAKKGYPRAQYYLGVCYDEGHGVEQNFKTAVKWYEQAAKNGNTDAKYRLANCYYHGNGTKQDYNEAVKLYKEAANADNALAMNNLGFCYQNGYGVEQNFDMAIECYEKAAKQDDAGALNNLAWCYEFGPKKFQNDEKADDNYRKAAEKGNAWAQYALARRCANVKNNKTQIDETQKYYNNSAKQYFFKAIIHLSLPLLDNNEDDDSKPFRDEYAVAFIDMLGTTQRIRDEHTTQKALDELRNIYNRFIEQNDKYYFFNTNKKPEWRIFSDNIVVFAPVKKPTHDYNLEDNRFYAFYVVFIASLFFQAWALEKKWTLRGGITMGQFYADNNLVWGEALVRAHDLEDKLAVNPRIIFDKKIAKMAEKAVKCLLEHLPDDENNKKQDLIITKDYDYYYLNYQFVFYLDEKLRYDKYLFYKLRDFLLSNLNNNSDERIINKYQWLIDSHNKWCENNGLKDHKIVEKAKVEEEAKEE